jgi:hypothetical protein
MLSVFQKTEDKMHLSADDVSCKFAITTMIFSNLGF